MIKNYLLTAFRNLRRFRIFSLINILGLSAAMSVCMLIMLMLTDQDRYDAFHVNKERIYRITSDYDGSRQGYATTPFPVAAALRSEYASVAKATVLLPSVGGDASYHEKYSEARGYFAEPAFFEIFSFDLHQGDKWHALDKPYSIVISLGLAEKLFGSENAIGKVIDFSDRKLAFPIRDDGDGAPAVNWGQFTVTGVFNGAGYVSHLTFDALMSASTLPALQAAGKMEDFSNNWSWFYRAYTFALLAPGQTKADLESNLQDLVQRKYKGVDMGDNKGFVLKAQPLPDVQLGLMGNDTSNRLPKIGYQFLAALAIVIMISACFNYTNLSVAKALTRAREIGVRKVTGASKRALVFQFLAEAVVTSFLSLAMAIGTLTMLRPAFRNLWINRFLQFELPFTTEVFIYFAAFALVTGLVAGLYPAFYLSGFQPARVLKDMGNIRPGKMVMRKILVTIQFIVSLFFITTSILIFKQFRHYMEFDYGFRSSHIVTVPLQGNDFEKTVHAFRSVAGVTNVSASDVIPGLDRNNGTQIRKPGSTGEFTNAAIINADEHFVDNLGVSMVAGRALPGAGEGASRYILVNETLSQQLGYTQPAGIVGQVFETPWNELLEVAGVMKDFHHKLLLNTDGVGPLVIRRGAGNFAYAQVAFAGVAPASVVASLEKAWNKVDPAHGFRYEFYDDQLASMHQGLFDVISILGYISMLAILIACLGLLGMATYAAEHRRKEVGIRKVMGADSVRILLLLSNEFVRLLAISIAVGAPLSYFVSNLWLEHLPNRASFGVSTLLISTGVLAALGGTAIGSQTLRASRNNPVEALKGD